MYQDVRTKFFYDGTVIRNMISELNNGRIVNLAVALMDNNKKALGGHAFNVFGYEKAEISSKEIDRGAVEAYIFYIYDCNYPDVVGKIHVVIKQHWNGQETMEYRLLVPGANYTGQDGGLDYYYFVAIDSDYNVLNEKR